MPLLLYTLYYRLYNNIFTPCLHCKNKIIKITNLLVSTVTRNSRICNLISHVGCYDCMVIYMYMY